MDEPAIKYDLETPLETGLLVGGILGAVATMILFAMAVLPSRGRPPIRALLPYVPVALVVTIVVFLLRWTADCYYVIRPGSGSVDYRFRFLFYEKITPFLTAGDVASVDVTGLIQRSKQSRWVNYYVHIVTKAGERIPFSDGLRNDEGLAEANGRGNILAEALGTPFEEGTVVPLDGGS